MAEMTEITNLRQYLGLATNKHNRYKSSKWLRGWRMNPMEKELFEIPSEVWGFDLIDYQHNAPTVPVKEVILDIYKKYRTQAVRRVVVWCYPEKFTIQDIYWRKCREQILATHPNICCRCGSTENLQVDHMLPKSKYPHLMYCMENLQILCKSCNAKKGSRVEKDYLRLFSHLLRSGSADVTDIMRLLPEEYKETVI